MISVTIADPLAEAANTQAKICHRGLNQAFKNARQIKKQSLIQ
jgi:hypothetical protein